MKLRRLIFLSSMVLAVAALSPAAAQGATNGTDRPLKGTITATAIDNLATGTATADGTFQFTHLGKGTFHEDATSPPMTGNTFTYTGTETYVAANGDKLFATVAATGTITFNPLGAQLTSVETITGGTGRFADASGTFTTTRVAVPTSIVGGIVTDPFTGTAVGQISY
jgi:hypothetical protein